MSSSSLSSTISPSNEGIVATLGFPPESLTGHVGDGMEWLVSVAFKSLKELKPSCIVVKLVSSWDQAVIEAAMVLQIPYAVAMPPRGFHTRWPKARRDTYKRLYDNAHLILHVPGCGDGDRELASVNRFIIEHAAKTLVLWNGKRDDETKAIMPFALAKHGMVYNAFPFYEKSGTALSTHQAKG